MRTGAIGGLLLFACTAVGTAEERPGTEKALAAVRQSASQHHLPLAYDGKRFSGPAWDTLVEEGRQSRFFLIGEEHGIAENPLLVAQLFTALAPSGYRRLVIEISPPMAAQVDEALQDGGLRGLRHLFEQPGGEPAFFGMTEEAQLLAAVRAAVPASEPALWGADYEVFSDRALLHRLGKQPMPAEARAALSVLTEASNAGWGRHSQTGDPQFIPTFAGDPQLVRNVEAAWPNPDPDSAWMLDTLRETLEINNLWSAGEPYASNACRAGLLRANFLRYWEQAKEDRSLRLMFKFGGNHMVRGRNMTQTFDLGNLIPEIAAAEGDTAFSVLVVPGERAQTAVLNPSSFEYEPKPPKDGYRKGLEALLDTVASDTMTLIDLRPVRATVYRQRRHLDERLRRVVFGFDMLLVMSGSTAATVFEHD